MEYFTPLTDCDHDLDNLDRIHQVSPTAVDPASAAGRCSAESVYTECRSSLGNMTIS